MYQYSRIILTNFFAESSLAYNCWRTLRAGGNTGAKVRGRPQRWPFGEARLPDGIAVYVGL